MLAAKQQVNAYRESLENPGKPDLYMISGKKRKRKMHYQAKTVLAVLCIFTMALLYTATEARITAYGYEINQLKQSIDAASNANARYQLEIEELSSPERLSAYAEENLDMVKPDDSSILYVDSQGITAAEAVSVFDSEVPSAQAASVEVIEGDTMHPVLATLNRMFNDYLVIWRDGQDGQQAAQNIQ